MVQERFQQVYHKEKPKVSILYWIINKFYLKLKSNRFYVEFTGFPHLPVDHQ